MATRDSQMIATTIANGHGYRVEIRQQTTGDHWDVRLYWDGEGYNPRSYSQRRDVSEAQIGDRIMQMLNELTGANY